MPIIPPSLSTLQARSQQDVATRIDGATPQLRRSILGAVVSALAGAICGLYGYIQQLSLRGTPFTAQGDDLAGWASLWGLTRLQPSAAAGTATFSGGVGSVIPAATQLQSSVGIVYATLQDATIAVGGTISTALQTTIPGALTNQASGATLSFISAVAGVNAAVTVDAGGLVGGTDLETDDHLRARLIARLSNPPQGGSQADYVAWALSVPGITRAWCFPLYSGIGTVRVYVADDSYTGATLASATDVANAQTYIDSVKPVGVAYVDGGGAVQNGLEVIAPTAQAVNMSIADVPDTADVQTFALVNLQALFATAAPEGTIKLHQIYKALLDTPGLTDFNMSAPAADQIATAGNILTLGTVTWL